MSKNEIFPEMLYANLDEDSGDVNAYAKQFTAVNDEGHWQEIAVYKLQEVRRLRKVTEEIPHAHTPRRREKRR